MGSFFGPPIRVGIPIGISAGFGKQSAPPAPPTTNEIITIAGDEIVTLAGDNLITL